MRRGRYSLAITMTALLISAASAHDTTGLQSLDFVGYSVPFGFEGQNYTDVWGSGDHAFLGSLASGVAIVDVTEPGAPILAAVYDPVGTATYEDIKVYGDVAYLGGNDGVHILDVANRSEPSLVGRISGSTGGFDSVNNLVVRDGLLYQVSTKDSAIRVFDVTDGASPAWLRDIETNDEVGLWDLTVTGDRLYVAGRGGTDDAGATYIYDISNTLTSNPPLLAQIPTGKNTASAAATSDRQYLVATQREIGGGLTLWDISDLDDPTQISSANAATYGINSYSAGSVLVDSSIVYAAWHTAGAQVLDLDLLDADGVPGRIGVFETATGASPLDGLVGNRSIYPGLGSHRVLLSDTRWGLYIVDATNVLSNPDINGDGQVTIDDIDQLVTALGSDNPSMVYDVNRDLVVDQNDLSDWLTSAGLSTINQPFRPGDANLDGQVDADDLMNWNTNLFSAVDVWSGGDFNADAVVDVRDFNIWNRNQTITDAATVPEPDGVLLLLAGLASFALSRSARVGEPRNFFR